jgi:hypothetical protein
MAKIAEFEKITLFSALLTPRTRFFVGVPMILPPAACAALSFFFPSNTSMAINEIVQGTTLCRQLFISHALVRLYE